VVFQTDYDEIEL